MIKLVMTDLDDTLVPQGQDGASDYALAAVHTLLDAGVRFGPVSGRVQSSMGWMFHNDEPCYQTGAFANGQVLYLDGKHVRTVSIDGAVLEELAQYLAHDELKVGARLAIVVRDNPNNTAVVEFVHEHPELLRDDAPSWLQGDFIPHATAPTYVKANVPCVASYDEVLALRERLTARFPELRFVMPSNDVPLIDILPASWDKGKGVLALAEAMGIAADEVAVFGDSENDLAMIRAIPNSVAVANAATEVQEAARWHIGASADEAVADALLQIAEAAKTGTMPAFMRA